MKKLLTLLTIAGIASSTCFAHFSGGAGSGDRNWNTAANWSDNTVPTAASAVQAIDVNLGYGVVVNNPGAQALYVDVGTWTWPGKITVASGGTLSIAENLFIAQDEGVMGVATNNGQLTVTAAVYMQGNTGTAGGDAVLVNNGTLTAAGMILGNVITGATTVVNTGTMNINGWVYLSLNASNTPTAFNMNGGTVNITGNLEMSAAGRNHLNLHGGTMTCGNLGLNGNGGYTIEVTFGELIATGDHTGGLDFMIGAGLITSTTGRTPYSTYDSGANATTLGSIPEPATIGLLAILGLAFLRRK